MGKGQRATRTSPRAPKAVKASPTSTRRSSRLGHNAKQSPPSQDDPPHLCSENEAQDIRMSPRRNDFSERSWWMVDVDSHDSGDISNQGATALVKRCTREYNWSLAKARKILQAYKQFLALKKEYQDWDASRLSPCFLVDLMWHQHILDVVNYCHDTMLLCGHVVGHNPDGALDVQGKAERDRNTRNALKKKFGSYDKDIWDIDGSNFVLDQPEAERNDPSDECPTTDEDSMDFESDEDGSNVGAEQLSRNNQRSKVSKTINIKLPLHKGGRKAASVRENSRTVLIKVRDLEEGGISSVRTMKNIRMAQIFDQYAKMNGKQLSKLKFLYGGRAINGRSTPRSLGISHGSEICTASKKLFDAPITIRVRDQTGEETYCKIKKLTRMDKLFDTYASRKGVQVCSLRFLLDGERIQSDATPSQLHLDDQDQIDCMLEQSGC